MVVSRKKVPKAKTTIREVFLQKFHCCVDEQVEVEEEGSKEEGDVERREE